MMYEVTIKKSIRRAMWQIKGENHTIYDLSKMESVILRLLKELDADPGDVHQVYLFQFSEDRYEGFQLQLTKETEYMDIFGTGCFYFAAGFNGFESRVFMSSCFHKMMKEWPERLYIGLQKTDKRIMVN